MTGPSATAPAPTGPCRDCGASVATQALVCPECGYDVARSDRLRKAYGFAGMALTLSVVLAPVGLPLLWLGYRHREIAHGTVTSTGRVPLLDHAATVLRQHVGLPALGERRAVVRRPAGVEESSR